MYFFYLFQKNNELLITKNTIKNKNDVLNNNNLSYNSINYLNDN